MKIPQNNRSFPPNHKKRANDLTFKSEGIPNTLNLYHSIYNFTK